MQNNAGIVKKNQDLSLKQSSVFFTPAQKLNCQICVNKSEKNTPKTPNCCGSSGAQNKEE